jgi:hypothetical protein
MSGFDLFGDVSVIDTGERSDFDYYPTPAFMTRSLLHFHPAIIGARVLEPCSGGDAITTVLRGVGCEVFTNDFDRRHPAMTHWNATSAEYWTTWAPRVDWVITNPPFNLAIDVLRHAVEHADVGVAFLLRKTFTEPTEDRGPWLQAHPPTRSIGEPRYPFRGSGSDSVSCDWYLWERRPDRTLPPFVIDYVAERRIR